MTNISSNARTQIIYIIIIPLINQSEIIGTLNFTNYSGAMKLSRVEFNTLKTYCNQISSAIYNSHLLKDTEIAKTDAGEVW